MVFAIGAATRPDIIPGLGKLRPQAEGIVVGGPETAERHAHPVKGSLPVLKGKALGQDHFQGKPQDSIQEPGRCARGVVFQAHDGAKGALAAMAGSKLDGVEAKGQPALADGSAHVP